MEALEYGRAKEVKGLLIALSNMELRLYNEKQLIYTLICEDVIAALRFGVFGREDGCLVLIYKKKGIDVKIIQRNFNFSVQQQTLLTD